MPDITPKQLAGLSAAAMGDFERRAGAHLAAEFPGEFADEAEAGAYARGCVPRAAAYGLDTEQAVICFAHIGVKAGDDFAQNPAWAWLDGALRSGDPDPSQRAKLALYRVLTAGA